jgi:polyferredoxin
LVNLPVRLDPLAMLAQLLASRALLAGAAVALITVALTLALGRAWCGWVCPLGTLLDLLPLRGWREKRRGPADSWRKVKYGLLLTTLGAALLGNLTLLVFDPLALLFRALSVSIWPTLDRIVTTVEAALYQVPMLRPTVSAFDGLVRPEVLSSDPAFYRHAMLYVGTLLGVILLNLVAERSWCRHVCPLGAALGLLSKVAIVRRDVNERCTRCDACALVCPTGTVQPAREYASDPGECTMCLECVAACPQDAVAFPARVSVAAWNAYDPSRRQALAALGAAVAGVGLFHGDLGIKSRHPYLIRPPGTQENTLLTNCIRCGECVRACPTSAIQPAVGEAGIEGLWTPILLSRFGYCDYSCNACGQVCPVEAIPPLSLEDKRQQVIGLAYIDQNRCIPWADNGECIVCEEMCPVPDKAILLEQIVVRNASGELVSVQRPQVIRERCIGCGVCEHRCPVDGEAAIRVYVPSL